MDVAQLSENDGPDTLSCSPWTRTTEAIEAARQQDPELFSSSDEARPVSILHILAQDLKKHLPTQRLGD